MVGGASGNESADRHYHPLQQSVCRAGLSKSVIQRLLVIEYDQNYTSFVVKQEVGGGALICGEALILDVGPDRRGAFEGKISSENALVTNEFEKMHYQRYYLKLTLLTFSPLSFQ